MSLRVAVVGASGFIGGRVVEALHLARLCEMRPVVRRASGLAALSKLDLDGCVADAQHEPSLIAAFERCDCVVHAVAGDPATIVGSVGPVYRAAQQAGVRRLVYLSSAAVHGQAPAPGTNETSPLDDRQPLPYNNAKVRAEQELARLRAAGATELVVLRPGIVTGPRSQWVTGFADRVLERTACLTNSGDGICNTIDVDNLVHAIYLAMLSPAADGQAFLLGDAETVSWADFYRPIATALGVALEELPVVEYREPQRTPLDTARAWKSSRAGEAVLSVLPSSLRRSLYRLFKGAWSAAGRAADFETLAPAIPPPTLETWLLQQCRYKLPDTKARTVLGYRPIVSFEQSLSRTLQWLEFAGYPVHPSSPRDTAGARNRSVARSKQP
jgi:nucleoside-diphosphate-sugar epimerase